MERQVITRYEKIGGQAEGCSRPACAGRRPPWCRRGRPCSPWEPHQAQAPMPVALAGPGREPWLLHRHHLRRSTVRDSQKMLILYPCRNRVPPVAMDFGRACKEAAWPVERVSLEDRARVGPRGSAPGSAGSAGRVPIVAARPLMRADRAASSWRTAASVASAASRASSKPPAAPAAPAAPAEAASLSACLAPSRAAASSAPAPSHQTRTQNTRAQCAALAPL